MVIIKVLSLFSGIGAFERALTNVGIDYELVGFSEIDKWAIESYAAIHDVPTDLNLGDVSEIAEGDLPNADLITYGFPCQDVSVAGQGAGITEGTRSGLLYEAERIIEHVKPKYAIAENVKNLIGKRHREDFDKLLERLEGYGYNNYWKVLNAKEFGIPQNRERVFIVSIRKDIDDGTFEFPQGFDSGIRLKDMLLDEVEEKYYIENEKTEKLLSELSDRVEPSVLRYERTEYGKEIRKKYESGEVEEKIGNMRELQPREDGVSNTLTTVQKDNWVLEPNEMNVKGNTVPSKHTAGRVFGVGGISPTVMYRNSKVVQVLEPNEQIPVGRIANYNQGSRVYDEEGIATTLTADGGRMAGPTGMYKVKGPNEIKRVGSINSSQDGVVVDKSGISPTHTAGHGNTPKITEPNELKLHKNLSGGKWDKIHQSARRVCEEGGVAPTVPTGAGGNHEPKVHTDYRIRKLTPQECWRLMGFEDDDYWTARRRLEEKFYNGGDRSNSQMYKQAGNSIVVDVLEHLFKKLLGGQP